MNVELFYSTLKEKNVKKGDLAKAINIDSSTLYRKVKRENFNLSELKEIKRILSLTHSQMKEIFLT